MNFLNLINLDEFNDFWAGNTRSLHLHYRANSAWTCRKQVCVYVKKRAFARGTAALQFIHKRIQTLEFFDEIHTGRLGEALI